ncbi:hypothetical protein HTZ84_22350 [Haloterrigena sp. SYSU A558-1]|uniref:Uncharacterized protein n=1 Tax=Haloterrigena gelatinilytica TaxID=2741724 RepID=A0ABX2LFI2_9EURY|nr:hypothetical protein [Haloterrigena gelatinilytica]NUC75009.1 hypothetical protein [Haloterrigena gelatinilytica]
MSNDRNLADRIESFTDGLSSIPPEQLGHQSVSVGTTQTPAGGRSYQSAHDPDDGLDYTPERDLENPDACPNCGFEPDYPDAHLSDGPDELLEKRAELLGEQPDSFWQSTTTTSSDGTYTLRIQCPDCDETVAEYTGEADGDMFVIPDGEHDGE